MKETFNVGVVGCGDISGTYLERCGKFDGLRILACSDLDRARAESQAKKYSVPKVLGLDELVQDGEIDIVLNLTPPAAHAPVSQAALEAGKHVYSEKPLAIDRYSGQKLIDAAESRNLRIGCAPDTFMGAGLQTVIQLIQEGAIGEPGAAAAFMVCHGHEHWHPSPEFYYEPGGGPLFDMGPYYLTALCAMLGPVRRVAGSTKTSMPERVVTHGPYKGRRIFVHTPTHITAILDFTCGVTATVIMSFDVWGNSLPHLEVYGRAGSLCVPDPNTFGGPVRLSLPEQEGWKEIPLKRPYQENSRGVGLADMAAAIRAGRPHRASGELAYHVLDVMSCIYDSCHVDRHIEPMSTVTRPDPMPIDHVEGVF